MEYFNILMLFSGAFEHFTNFISIFCMLSSVLCIKTDACSES